MRFAVKTLGCKVNAYESEFYAQKLKERGHIQDQEHFDVCIINTCTVTNTAAAKSRQMISRARKKNPEAKIVVVGCYAQTAEKAEKDALQADLLIGSRGKSTLADQVEMLFGTGLGAVSIPDGFESMPVSQFSSRHRAFLKVQDGCNQFCSYCAIPFARGRERSLDPEEAVQTAISLAESGHEEIVLTGIHTGRYQAKDTDLAQLLEKMLKAVPEHVTFRISSIEITEVSDALIDLMARNPRLQPHLHIPIQSGCDTVLARMHRPYTVKEFADRLQKIREKLPSLSVSTDVITGFAQESEAEHQETLASLEAMGFSFLHVFPFSVRKGTEAEKMGPFVPGDVQKHRVHDLVQLSESLRQKDMERFPVIDVLTEQEKDGVITGYSAQYHPVRIQSQGPVPKRVHGPARVENGVYIMEKL